MPKSPREHVIERESHAAFELVLGDRFVYRRENPDYRIDGVIEEIDGDDITGLRFYAQLKATDEEDLSKALGLSLSHEDRAYYKSLSLPVLMVRYHAPSKTFYTRWINEYDPYYGRGGKKTFTFRWSESDAWDDGRADKLIAEAKVFAELRSPNPSLPRPVHVISDGAFGFSQTELLYAYRGAAAKCGDVLEICGGPPVDGAAWIEVSENEVAFHLAKVSGAVLHLPDGYDPGELGELLAIDGLLMAAPTFATVRQYGIASRAITGLAPHCQLVGDAGFANALQGIMGGARRVTESLTLADNLDQHGDAAVRGSSILFTLPALQHGEFLSKAEADLHRKTLRRRINRRKRDGDPIAMSREMVNLANFHRRRREAQKAIHLYREAAAADPDYEERAHYWHELGGVLWMDRQYKAAAEAYARGIELGSEPIAKALYADCLMFAGEYETARDLFAEFNTEHPEIADEYRLKEIALNLIVDELKITQQARDMDAAVKAAPRIVDGVPREAIVDSSLKQLSRDALWSSAWYNLGVAAGESRNQPRALFAFVAATILMPEFDLEPWTRAIFYSWNLGEKDLLRDILTTARRQAGPPVLKELVKFGREQDKTFPREELLQEVDTILAESPAHHGAGYTIRLLGPDGVKEIEVNDIVLA